MTVFHQLNEGSTDLQARIDLAWAALHDDGADPRSEDRVAAKCWLTYRIVDGALPLDRWEHVARVIPRYVNPHGLVVRWRISQLTAEMYLHGLRRHHLEDLLDVAESIRANGGLLHLWPASVLNWLRASCVCALRERDALDRERMVEEAINTWQHVMGSVIWKDHPMRFVEMRDDLSALWQLIAIAKRCGLVDYKPFSWLPKFNGGSDHFARLMRLLDAPQL